MRKTNVRWQKRAAALLVLCAAGLLSACNDDPAAEPPSLAEEHGLQVAASHYHERPLLTPEQSAERGFRYCPVYGHFFVAVRSASGTMPKDLTAVALFVSAPGGVPVALEGLEFVIEPVDQSGTGHIGLFREPETSPNEDRLNLSGLACVPDDGLARHSKLDLSLTVRSGGREVTLGGVSNRAGDGLSIGY